MSLVPKESFTFYIQNLDMDDFKITKVSKSHNNNFGYEQEKDVGCSGSWFYYYQNQGH